MRFFTGSKTKRLAKELSAVKKLLEMERKKYEKNRRQKGRWVFQDLDYGCCSSYGRPRSKSYHYEHYVKLIEEAGVPYITFHDLRHTYTTILMKNNINQRAIASALGHSKTMITVDVYTDMQRIIEDCVKEMQEFISEVHPYDATDKQMLERMFQEKIEFNEPKQKINCIHYIPGIIIYDYSDVYELDDIAEWHMEKRAG